ncbi:hypothetical protein [Anthocerotibacter panamensis]|uniref:hypothetical protein n=1 Tax=Anthocerotibacter panamensis TaxID=2857077 RepID=UPI001C40590C|nr:hypothetical protein [Anthocerotibacter panamensis]
MAVELQTERLTQTARSVMDHKEGIFAVPKNFEERLLEIAQKLLEYRRQKDLPDIPKVSQLCLESSTIDVDEFIDLLWFTGFPYDFADSSARLWSESVVKFLWFEERLWGWMMNPIERA